MRRMNNVLCLERDWRESDFFSVVGRGVVEREEVGGGFGKGGW